MVLIDSSVWIEYFKGRESALPLNKLIDLNCICINDLILSELLPAINHKKEHAVKELLLAVTRIPLEISWEQIIRMQTLNLKKGINRIDLHGLRMYRE